MRRAMMFIDYENFEAARRALYRENQVEHTPRLDIPIFPQKFVAEKTSNVDLLKTFLFVPEPEGVLAEEEHRTKLYNFLKGLENTDYLTVISGRHCVRPVNGDYSTINIANKKTFYVVEKGTDVNIATQLLTKAFHNSYDIAIVVSADADYLPVYDILNTLGKLVMIVYLEGQNISKIRCHTDQQICLDFDFLKSCESTFKAMRTLH